MFRWSGDVRGYSFALVVHLVQIDFPVLTLGEDNRAVVVGYRGEQPARLGERLLNAHQVVLAENIPQRIRGLVVYLHGVLAAVAAHYDVLALAVEVVGDVEHHALDEFKGASAAVDLTSDIEPLVVAAVIEPRVELYFICGSCRDLRYYLAERLVIVRVNNVAHDYSIPCGTYRVFPASIRAGKPCLKLIVKARLPLLSMARKSGSGSASAGVVVRAVS